MTTNGTGRKVTLTFDNGPTRGITDQVLDVLAERGVVAYFFVVGSKLRQPGARDLVRRAVAQGHRIGHHTTTHTTLLGEADDAQAVVQSEIADLAPELEEFDGSNKLYRPYAAGGILDQNVFSHAAVQFLQAHEYTCVLWNSVPHDWDGPDSWVDRALADVMRRPWTVVVLHDIDTGAMAHLPAFLDELSARDIQITQDLPDSCVPIRAGQVMRPLSHLIKETTP
jgi:peptidoglycan/xylan/chitin deacetylase (PgdA/CDA1 family)